MGTGSEIQDQEKAYSGSWILDSRVKSASDPGSGSATPVPTLTARIPYLYLVSMRSCISNLLNTGTKFRMSQIPYGEPEIFNNIYIVRYRDELIKCQDQIGAQCIDHILLALWMDQSLPLLSPLFSLRRYNLKLLIFRYWGMIACGPARTFQLCLVHCLCRA
jgi:hypothetical protein